MNPVQKLKNNPAYTVPPILRSTSSLPAHYYTAEAGDAQDQSDTEDLMFDIEVNDDVPPSVEKAAKDPIEKERPLSSKVERMIILRQQRAAEREAKKTIIGISPETKIINGFTTKSSSSYVDSLKSEETNKEEYMCLI